MVWLRRVGWGVAGPLAVWALAWLTVPPLLKSQAQTRLSALLGREVSIGEVAFKPWLLNLTLRNVRVKGLAAAGEPLLQLAQAHLDLSINSLFRRAPVIEALELDGLRLRSSPKACRAKGCSWLRRSCVRPATKMLLGRRACNSR